MAEITREQFAFRKPNVKKDRRKKKRRNDDVQEVFRKEVLEADREICQDIFCNHEGFGGLFRDVHHLIGKNHTDVSEGITLCRVAHEKCERGFYGKDGYYVTAREYETKILEWYEKHDPENRWGEVLELFRRTARPPRNTHRTINF